jgi:hypothetical protein
LKRSWDAGQWKKSTKLLLGLGTIWPDVYLLLFVIGLFSITLFANTKQTGKPGYCGLITLTQLDERIRNGEVAELAFTESDIVATNTPGTCEFHIPIRSETTRATILQTAQERDANGKPRVAKINQNADPEVPKTAIFGFAALFIVHMLTILWIIALVVFYVLLAVKNDQLDQNMKIVWSLSLCLLTMLAMPVYWYLYVWKKRPAVPRSNPIAPPTGAGIQSIK